MVTNLGLDAFMVSRAGAWKIHDVACSCRLATVGALLMFDDLLSDMITSRRRAASAVQDKEMQMGWLLS